MKPLDHPAPMPPGDEAPARPDEQIAAPRTSLGAGLGAGLDLGPLPTLIGYALRRAQVAVFADFERSFVDLQLRPAQFSVLLLIRHNPGCKQSDIAEALGIQRPNFVALMDELDRRGLTERRTSVEDRRSYALFLTSAGATLLDAAMIVVAKHEQRLIDALAPADPAVLLEILGRIEHRLPGA